MHSLQHASAAYRGLSYVLRVINILTGGVGHNDFPSVFFQKRCVDYAINKHPLCRYMPKDKKSWKYRIWRLVVSTPFEYYIMVMIALNTLILMMKVSDINYSIEAYKTTWTFSEPTFTQWVMLSSNVCQSKAVVDDISGSS